MNNLLSSLVYETAILTQQSPCHLRFQLNPFALNKKPSYNEVEMFHLNEIGRLLNVFSVTSIILLTDNDIAIVCNRVYIKKLKRR